MIFTKRDRIEKDSKLPQIIAHYLALKKEARENLALLVENRMLHIMMMKIVVLIKIKEWIVVNKISNRNLHYKTLIVTTHQKKKKILFLTKSTIISRKMNEKIDM